MSAHGPEPSYVALPPAPAATLGQYADVFRRRLKTVATCVLLGVALAGALLLTTPRSYEATAVVDVSPVFGTSSGSDSASSTTTITESRIAASTSVAQIAKRLLGYSGTPSALLEQVVVSSPLDSRVLNMTFTSGSAEGAAAGANAFADAYLDYRTNTVQNALNARVARLSTQIADYERAIRALRRPAPGQDASQYTAQRASFQRQIQELQGQVNTYQTSVIRPGEVAGRASAPPSPSAPKPTIYLAGGVLLGLVVGLLIAVLRDRRDDLVHDAATVEEVLGAPVLAETTTSARAGELAPLSEPDGAEADAYRMVTTTMAPENTSRQVVLVCGAGAGTDATAAANLAVTFATQGLRTVLAGTRSAMDAAAEVLGAGPAPTTGGAPVARPDGTGVPAAHLTLLSLGEEVALAATLRAHGDNLADVLSTADVVVLDGLSTTLPSALLRLGGIADEAVVVVHQDQTSTSDLSAVAERLAQVGTTVLGSIVLGGSSRPRRGRRPAPAAAATGAAPVEINVDRYDIASRNAFRRDTSDRPAARPPVSPAPRPRTRDGRA